MPVNSNESKFANPIRFDREMTGILAGMLVAMAAFLVCANSLGNEFTRDDDIIISTNPVLRESAVTLPWY